MLFSRKQFRFTEYYNDYFEKIYNYIFFRVGQNRTLAEEFTQDVFLKALENFDSFDQNSNFATWIYRIAHNHVIDHYRRKKLEKTDLEKVENTLAASKSASETFVRETETKMQMGHVNKAMESLNDMQRELITLRYINEYEIEEVAQVLGKDANYVRVNIHRALQKLNSLIVS